MLPPTDMKIRKNQENMICLKCCLILFESLFLEIFNGILTPNTFLKLCMEIFLVNLISIISKKSFKVGNL